MTAFHAEALLFDMDGTLVDSTAAVETAWRSACERWGIDAEAVLAVTHGVPARDTIAKFWPLAERAAAFEWIETAECTMLDGVVPIPGAVELSQRLNDLRAPWGIVTSATPELAAARLGAAGIALPDVLVTIEHVEFGKPHPAPFLLGAERLGADPRHSIVVEDAPAGIRSGLAAGATVVVRGPHGGADAAGLLVIDDYLGTQIHQAAPISGKWR